MSKPVYLIGGGRPQDPKSAEDLVRYVLKDIGIPSPVIAYSGTANGDDSGFFKRIKAQFIGAGAASVLHAVIDRPGADIAKARDILEQADIVFLSGGDVDHGMDVLQEYKLTDFLRELFRQGKPFFGISAGAIMMAREWIRWPDPEDPENAELFPCLGFASVVCDCHDEASGWEELRALLELEPDGEYGYGLAMGSAIRVAVDGSVTAFGDPVHRFVRRSGSVMRVDDLVP